MRSYIVAVALRGRGDAVAFEKAPQNFYKKGFIKARSYILAVALLVCRIRGVPFRYVFISSSSKPYRESVF